MTRTVVYRAGGFTNCGIGYTKFSQEELAEMKDRVMTENDAKTFLKIEKECINRNCDRNCAQCDIVQKVEDLNSAYDAAIKALEEVQQYRAIGTPEECRTAVEKQMPKRPKEYEDKYYGCPTCGNVLLHKWEKYPDKLMDKSNGLPYCLGCGQKLDWSDEE